MKPSDFARLIEPHLPVLHRLARRLCRTRSDAEDLAQEALIRAFERRGSLREPERIRGWILATVRNLHLNRVRDARPHLLVLSDTRGTDEEPRGDLERELQDGALSDELLLALRQLPEEQATVLWLRSVEDLSYEEIAEAMETPVGTVRSRLSRARVAMIEALETKAVAAGGER
ncbi:RNA polymerase sigma factor [Vulgatibacter incomptus]|uniref:RNA polymerase sigma-54 factor RpoN n=1 Tax=Vulgatibacter incomptus TaxID=1391653 RepID=A0A0K1PE66_9BACT|nr:sigma-70 family RNA polymerase sigma factor [Vulgatibacter incomptus]AKU91787.1 RNA polymerase sigma-54 factor RpoN [Vulgatibacter incomptus]